MSDALWTMALSLNEVVKFYLTVGLYNAMFDYFALLLTSRRKWDMLDQLDPWYRVKLFITLMITWPRHWLP